MVDNLGSEGTEGVQKRVAASVIGLIGKVSVLVTKF